MSLLRRSVMVEKGGVGRMVMTVRRRPFRLFGEGLRVFYQPALDGAAWHPVDIRRVDLQVLASCESAFTAMAYLRSFGKS